MCSLMGSNTHIYLGEKENPRLKGGGASAPGVVVREVFEGTNGRDDGVDIAERVPGDALNVVDGDGIDAEEGLDGGEASAEGDELATNILREGRRAVELHEIGRLDAVLGALEFSGAEGAEEGELLHNLEREFLDAIIRGDERDSKETSRVVRSVEGRVRVSECLVGSDFREARVERVATTHGLVPRTDEVLDEEEGEVVGVGPGGTLEGDGGSDLVEGIVANLDFRTSKLGGVQVGLRFEVGRGVGSDGTKVLLSEFDNFFVLNGACSGDDHSLSDIVSLQVGYQIISSDGSNVLLLTQDGVSQ